MPSKIRDIADILGVTEAANPTKAVLTSAADGSSVSVYDSAGLLPLSDLTSGDQAYVESTNRFYMSNGSGWYNIALVNTNPSISVSGGSPIELDNEGGSTAITATSSDPEEVPITFTAVTNAAFDDFATVTNVDNVFTITPKAAAISAAANDTGTITFRASDGVNIATVNRTVNLTFTSIDSLTSSVNSVNEGGVVTFYLNVTGYPNGSTFPYTITGVSSADLDGIPLTGNIDVVGGAATLDVALVSDNLTEGTETITFSAGGLTKQVTVNDTSVGGTWAVSNSDPYIAWQNPLGPSQTIFAIPANSAVGTWQYAAIYPNSPVEFPTPSFVTVPGGVTWNGQTYNGYYQTSGWTTGNGSYEIWNTSVSSPAWTNEANAYANAVFAP